MPATGETGKASGTWQPLPLRAAGDTGSTGTRHETPEPLFTWKGTGSQCPRPSRARSGEALDRRPAERGPIPWVLRRSMAPRVTYVSTVLSSHLMIPAASRRDTQPFASYAAMSASSRSWRTISLTASTGIHQRGPARTAPRGIARLGARLGSDPRLGRRLKCGHVANRRRWPQRLSSCCPGGELCSRRCARSVSRAGYQRPNSSTEERRRVGRRLSSGRCSMRPWRFHHSMT